MAISLVIFKEYGPTQHLLRQGEARIILGKQILANSQTQPDEANREMTHIAENEHKRKTIRKKPLQRVASRGRSCPAFILSDCERNMLGFFHHQHDHGSHGTAPFILSVSWQVVVVLARRQSEAGLRTKLFQLWQWKPGILVKKKEKKSFWYSKMLDNC